MTDKRRSSGRVPSEHAKEVAIELRRLAKILGLRATYDMDLQPYAMGVAILMLRERATELAGEIDTQATSPPLLDKDLDRISLSKPEQQV